MSDSSWLEGSYEEALRLVAERSLYSRGVGSLVKRADLSDILSNPDVQHGLVGAGIGAAGGLAANALGEGGHAGRNLLMGGLLGAGAGVGGGRLLDHFHRPSGPVLDPRAQAEAVHKSQGARQELGILGADEGKLNKAVGGLRSGALSDSKARNQMEDAVPGAATQLSDILPAAGVAARQGRFGDAANQLDIGGVKNLNPLSRHFSPLTATTAVGANLAARGHFTHLLPQQAQDWLIRRRLPHTDLLAGSGKTSLKGMENAVTMLRADPKMWHALNDSERDAVRVAMRDHMPADYKPGRLGRLTGGMGPALAGLAPLALHEWFSGSGYRSGAKPIQDLVEANRILNRS